MGCNPTADDWRRFPTTDPAADDLKNEITPVTLWRCHANWSGSPVRLLAGATEKPGLKANRAASPGGGCQRGKQCPALEGGVIYPEGMGYGA